MVGVDSFEIGSSLTVDMDWSGVVAGSSIPSDTKEAGNAVGGAVLGARLGSPGSSSALDF